MPGLLIKYKHAPKHPGFWYPCKRKEVRDVLATHMTYWGREQVKVGDEEVVRAVPVESVVATFCTAYRAVDGEGVADDPEPIDVAKELGV